MKLPQSFIKYHLKDMVSFSEKDACPESDILLKRPVFWERDMEMVENMIIFTDSIPITAQSVPNILWITEKAEKNKKGIILGVVRRGGNLQQISNRLHRLFDLYENWERNLSQLIDAPGALQHMVSLSQDILGNPVVIMNAHYMIVSFSASREYFQKKGLPEFDAAGYLSEDLVNLFKNDENFFEARKNQSSFIYIGEGIPGKVLCHNIFSQGVCVGRVCMADAEREFCQWDSFFLSVLTGYLQKCFVQEQKNYTDDQEITRVFLDLLHDRNVKYSRVLNFLNTKNWKEHSYFRLCVLQPSVNDLSNHTLDFFCYHLTVEYENCIAVADGNEIIILIYYGERLEHSHDINQRLAFFIRENNFRMGFSNYFQNINGLHQFYVEGTFALAYGQKTEPTIWRYSFGDYLLEYVIEKSSEEIKAEHLIAPELKILLDYDRKHDTELCRTLKCYLDNRQSPVLTAKKLFIQRGTLNYRIKRIRQLTKLNLNDWKVLLKLQLSYAMAGNTF